MLLNSAPKRSKIQATKGQKTPKLYGLLGRIYASVVFAREQRSPWSMASARCDAQSRLSCGVRPSLSVCLSRSRTLSKRINISSKIFHQQVATLFKFLYQTSWQYSNGNPPPPNWGVECTWNQLLLLPSSRRRLCDAIRSVILPVILSLSVCLYA